MSKITGNEPAMPIRYEGDLGQMNSAGGLTIRQHYAGLAMQGFLSTSRYWIDEPEKVAEWSVRQADALINALNQSEQLKTQ